MIKMVEISAEFDVTPLVQKLNPSQIKEVKAKGLNYAAQETVRVLQRNSPVDHGVLKQWFIESIDDEEAIIKTPAAYAADVNYGTRPHFIYPTNKKMLYWEGADHPVPYVVHPGTTPTLFVENSIAEVETRLSGYFLKALEEVLG